MSKKRVLVVGGTGFIGLHLCERLARAGHDLTILADVGAPASCDSFLRAADVRIGDVRHEKLVSELVRGKDEVVNLAAVVNKNDRLRDPVADLEVNCKGQLLLLEAIRHGNPGARLIFFSTSMVFGRNETKEPIPESFPREPLNMYGAHKLAGEHYCELYHRAFGIRSAILRPSGVYGPSLGTPMSSHAVALFIKQALNHEAITVLGDGTDVKDWLYVGDVVDATAKVMDSDIGCEAFNLGSKQQFTTGELAEKVRQLCGGGRVEMKPFTERMLKFDARSLILDSSKAKRVLGWESKMPLDEGVAATVAYYRKLTANGKQSQ